jgi:hypothetical protein
MRPKGRKLAVALFVAVASLSLGAEPYAQVQVPSKKDRIGTPGALTLPRRPPELGILSVARPHGVVARANAPFDVTFNVSVRNTGQLTGEGWLAATLVPGSVDAPRSGPLRVGPGRTARTSFRIQAQMRPLATSAQLPIVIRLLGNDGRELDRRQIVVPYLSECDSANPETPKEGDTAALISAVKCGHNPVVDSAVEMQNRSHATKIKVRSHGQTR